VDSTPQHSVPKEGVVGLQVGLGLTQQVDPLLLLLLVQVAQASQH